MDTKRKWHKGPPPHVGWWNASKYHFEDCWRWWNGSEWSHFAWTDYGARMAGRRARVKAADSPALIEWSDYYPDNARVPRINPEAK